MFTLNYRVTEMYNGIPTQWKVGEFNSYDSARAYAISESKYGKRIRMRYIPTGQWWEYENSEFVEYGQE